MKQKAVLSWSGGKDSVLALAALLGSSEWEIAALVSGMIEGEHRLTMHEVPEELIETQARALGLPFAPYYLPRSAENSLYEERLLERLGRFKQQGVAAIAFGDIFLEDIRAYREKLLTGSGFMPVFPNWRADSHDLARRFLNQGYSAITVCVDSRVLDASFAGVELDRSFYDRLPASTDPCGENGEFHTFVFDGPLFSAPVCFGRGGVERRGNFYFCELEPR